jgi:hypothetical protein
LLHALAALFFLIFLLAVGHGDAGRVGGAALKALTNGWKRKNRVALLTVATHMSRLAETSDSESGRGVHVFCSHIYITLCVSCVLFCFTNSWPYKIISITNFFIFFNLILIPNRIRSF